ncbi:MAG TPA: adenylate/guanylate cyclase domain-containing protein [Candidatus Polarisedimenticolia bacterium]|jgi:adenylate cyclase|nr:adenylate/guanylate cyclase domain-containing protein [Candidatus Polarisedimenticolia bacterium]
MARRSRQDRSRALQAGLLIALIPGLAGILLLHWPPAESLETYGLDFLFQWRGVQAPPDGVCVVVLDDESYEALDVDPALPWPRRLHAELIRTLTREGARTIAFDILFDKPRDAAEDEAFRQALSASGKAVLGETVELTEDPRFRRAQLVEPYSPFASAAAAVGDVGLPTDRDGVIRRAWLVHEDRPSLALAAYEVATSDRRFHEAADRLIDYYGPARSVRTVSFYQALEPERHLPAGFFKGKIVFVGIARSSAAGPAAKDAFLTPFRGASGESTFGVEIHATLAANLLEGKRIGLLPGAAEAALLLLLPLLAIAAFMALRPLLGGAAFLLLLVLPPVAGLLAFTRGHVWIPIVIPTLVQLPAAYVLSLVWYYLTTARERERIRRAFSFYLSPDMIQQIAANPGTLNLGGEEIVATALFTDIKGFTPIAEKLTAPETAALLNDYFSGVTGHIFEEGGTLIKYIGDAVFAIWNAPLRREDHAAAACRAALALARSQDDGGPDEAPAAGKLITRIGVHTGPMLVGNLGSAQRFDYTAIGDAVNLASRLEGLNKALGTRALVSGETLDLAGGGFLVRRLGRAQVVGRSEAVEVCELLAEAGEAARIPADALDRFHWALAAFVARRFEEAAEGFQSVRELCGGADGPSEFYLRAIQRLAAEPPPPGWDGVMVIESK